MSSKLSPQMLQQIVSDKSSPWTSLKCSRSMRWQRRRNLIASSRLRESRRSRLALLMIFRVPRTLLGHAYQLIPRLSMIGWSGQASFTLRMRSPATRTKSLVDSANISLVIRIKSCALTPNWNPSLLAKGNQLVHSISINCCNAHRRRPTNWNL